MTADLILANLRAILRQLQVWRCRARTGVARRGLFKVTGVAGRYGVVRFGVSALHPR